MTLIVSPKVFTSKAALKAALDSGDCYVHEPSIVGEWQQPSRALAVGFSGVVTNHPLRTKFAQIERRVRWVESNLTRAGTGGQTSLPSNPQGTIPCLVTLENCICPV